MTCVAGAVVWVTDYFISYALLVMKKLLQSNNGGQDQSDLADDEGFTSDQSNGTESKRDECSGLQFESKE